MSSMALLYILVSVSLFWFSVDCSIVCSKSYPRPTKSRLQEFIVCGNDLSQQPPTNDKKMEVTLNIYLRHLEMDEENKILYVYMNIYMIWKDSRLKWNPADYDNIKYLKLVDDDNVFWKPELGLVTLTKPNDDFYLSESFYIVTNLGDMIFSSWATFYIPCEPDINHWPYDSLVCEALLAPWDQKKVEIEIYNGGVKTYYKDNTEWNLLDFKVKDHKEKVDNSTYQFEELKFTLDRFSPTYEAVTVVPALILCLVTLVSSWIQVEKATRLCAICTVLICQVYFLQYLSFLLHTNSARCPHIVLFYRDSMAVTTFSLSIILIIKWINSCSSVTPVWINKIDSIVEGNQIGYWILHFQEPKQIVNEGAEETNPKTGEQNWYTFGLVLDRLTFLIKLVTIVVLLILHFGF